MYISVDMEGVAGVATLDQIARGGTGYPRAQELMTAEVNAAVAGAFDGGAESVLVNDSHGTMDNLLHERLDERAEVTFGLPKAQCMAHGLAPEHDVALFVGYHAAAGAPGVLSHTFSSYFTELRVNGVAASEAEVNALQAAGHGVPVGLVTGDSDICQVAEKQFPGVSTVAVKRAEGWSAATSRHPAVARSAIREAAATAVRGADGLAPPSLPDRLVLEVDFQQPTMTELAAQVPGTQRTGHLTVRREVDSPDQLVGLVNVWYELADQGARSRLALLNRR